MANILLSVNCISLIQGVPSRGSVFIDVKNDISGNGKVLDSVKCTITDLQEIKAVHSTDEDEAAAVAAAKAAKDAKDAKEAKRKAHSKQAVKVRPVVAKTNKWQVERLLGRQTIDGDDWYERASLMILTIVSTPPLGAPVVPPISSTADSVPTCKCNAAKLVYALRSCSQRCSQNPDLLPDA